MFKPDARFKKITDIEIDFFKKKNIKGIILDLDNTLIKSDGNLLDGIEKWIQSIKKSNIKLCIATNSINLQKIKEKAEKLEIPFVYKSCKPSKYGMKKAIKILGIKEEYIAEIGDQLFTDVCVSNRMKIFSILTEPISKDRFMIDKLKRKVEKWILAKNT